MDVYTSVGVTASADEPWFAVLRDTMSNRPMRGSHMLSVYLNDVICMICKHGTKSRTQQAEMDGRICPSRHAHTYHLESVVVCFRQPLPVVNTTT